RLQCLSAMIELRQEFGDFDALIEPSERLLDWLGISRGAKEHPNIILFLIISYFYYAKSLWLSASPSEFVTQDKLDRLVPLASKLIASRGGIDGLLDLGVGIPLLLAQGYLF